MGHARLPRWGAHLPAGHERLPDRHDCFLKWGNAERDPDTCIQSQSINPQSQYESE